MNRSPVAAPTLPPHAGISSADTSLRRLPLQDLHREHGATLSPFAGFAMPLHYRPGILAEHRQVRADAGLFDVSHMGQITLRARSGDLNDAARALEFLVPADLVSLRTGRQRYAVFTEESGGVLDDLMVARYDSFLMLIVNAARVDADLRHLRERLPPGVCSLEHVQERVLLAIQGPAAGAALSTLSPATAAMRFMDAACCVIGGAECFVTRSGYTGEDGFELSIPAAAAEAVAEGLLQHPAVRWAGLGARDSLRLEAGLCLYGHDLSVTTTPVEAGLSWAIGAARRSGGARAAGFPGAGVILQQLADGPPRRRVGLRAERPVREGCALFADAGSTEQVGEVTSGSFGPSVRMPVAMAYVPAAAAATGARLFADVRGHRTPVVVSEMPFFPHRYLR